VHEVARRGSKVKPADMLHIINSFSRQDVSMGAMLPSAHAFVQGLLEGWPDSTLPSLLESFVKVLLQLIIADIICMA
jgi:hypothetical protein